MRRLILFVVAAAALACAQTKSALQFEVATIKPVDPKAMHTLNLMIYRNGRIIVPSVTWKDLIATAFDLAGFQISGAGG